MSEDDSFIKEERRSLPLDEEHRIELNENSETASHERAGSNAMAQSSQRPRLYISKDDVRSVPDSALRVPARSVQVSPVGDVRTSGKAIAALVFGILGIPLMGILLGPFAIIFGGWAVYEINHTNYLAGKPLALSGIYLGIFDILLWSFIFLLLLIRALTQGPPAPGMTLFAR